MDIRITKVFSDDYEVIYVNGIIEYDVFKLNKILLNFIEHNVKSYQILYISKYDLEEFYNGEFPTKLKDIDKKHLC